MVGLQHSCSSHRARPLPSSAARRAHDYDDENEEEEEVAARRATRAGRRDHHERGLWCGVLVTGSSSSVR